MSTSTIEQIEIRNVGPISHISVPYIPGGGLCVFKGPQGAGKTTAVCATDMLATGKGKLTVKDGELGGSIEGMGVRITIGSRTTRSGEPTVTSIEGRLSVADLVDPQIKDPVAADRHRIKAIVQLAGVKPSPEMFHRLVGDRAAFEAVVKPASIETEDLVQMAEAVKRDLEAAARKAADQAEHAEGRARGAKEAAGDVDASAECDAGKLNAAHESAIREQSRLSAELAAHKKAERAAQAARDALEDSEAGYSGPTLDEAKEIEAVAKCNVTSANDAVLAAEASLAKARADQAAANVALATAIRTRKDAESHEATLKSWRETIAASVPPAPSLDALATADARVDETRKAVETGTLIRAAKRHLADCAAAVEEAAKHRKESDRLREAAKGTDEVLSEAVAKTGSPLRVEAGRLIVKTARRGKTRFAELSDGERWILGLDIAIEFLGERGVIGIPQWAWGELQPANQKKIADHLRARGVMGYAAEATDDDELHAEIFGAGANGHK